MKRHARSRRYWPPDGADFKEARLVAGLSSCEVAELLHVSARTVRNWESGRSQVPYSAFKLLRVLRGYELPEEAWAGWHVRGDTLWSPTHQPFHVGGMAYLGLVFAMARHWLIDRGYSNGLAC